MTRRPIILLVLTVLFAASCGGSGSVADDAVAEGTTTTFVVAPSTTAAAAAPITDVAERVAPVAEPSVEITGTPLRHEAIVAAAVVIASGGDLEAAILDGVVTEAEAEAALQAIEDGTLGELLTLD